MQLFALFGGSSQCNASVERDGFKLDVEAFAVSVRPSAANANPVIVAAFAVANIVGEVAGRPRRGGFGFVGVSHVKCIRIANPD